MVTGYETFEKTLSKLPVRGLSLGLLAKPRSFVNIRAALIRWSNVALSLCKISTSAFRTILFVDAMSLPRSFPFQPSPPA